MQFLLSDILRISAIVTRNLLKIWLRSALEFVIFAINNFNWGDVLFTAVVLISIVLITKSVFRLVRNVLSLWAVLLVFVNQIVWTMCFLVIQITIAVCLLVWIGPWTEAIKNSLLARIFDNPMGRSFANGIKDTIFASLQWTR